MKTALYTPVPGEKERPQPASLSCSVIIATRNRPEPIRECLASLVEQTLLPREIIIVDASDGGDTAAIAAVVAQEAPFALVYRRASACSAARQRNEGADAARGDLLVFLDDDVVLEKDFLKEVADVFEKDGERSVGGVSGIIVNQSYVPLSRLNRLMLAPCLGGASGNLAGRLVGPALNFLPEDRPNSTQRVEWLLGGCTAYREDVFRAHRFPDRFTGYSFAEDVHLSARVGKDYLLVNTTRARLRHKDLGNQTHRDWSALAEMALVNRYDIMTNVLARRSFADFARLLAYEFFYCTASALWNARSVGDLGRMVAVLRGKIRGTVKIVRGRSPHQADCCQGA